MLNTCLCDIAGRRPASVQARAESFADRYRSRTRQRKRLNIEWHHAVLDRLRLELIMTSAAAHQAANCGAHLEQFVDGDSSMKARSEAFFAAAASPEFLVPAKSENLANLRARLFRDLAMLAITAGQPLRQYAGQRRVDEIGLDADLDKPGNRLRRAVRMQRGQYQVAGKRALDRDLGRVSVADLADQYHVGIVTQNIAQRR